MVQLLDAQIAKAVTAPDVVQLSRSET